MSKRLMLLNRSSESDQRYQRLPTGRESGQGAAMGNKLSQNAAPKAIRPKGLGIRRFMEALPWGLAERGSLIVSILEQLGIKGVVGAVFVSALVGVATWYWSHVPWYASLVLALVIVYFSLGVWHRFQLIRATSQFDSKGYQVFGEQLLALANEMLRFMSDRQREKPLVRKGSEPASLEAWQSERDFEAVSGRMFMERFGPRLLSNLALLRKLGIEPPSHMITMLAHGSSTSSAAHFFALIGQLLADGNLEEAVTASNDRQFMWAIGH